MFFVFFPWSILSSYEVAQQHTPTICCCSATPSVEERATCHSSHTLSILWSSMTLEGHSFLFSSPTWRPRGSSLMIKVKLFGLMWLTYLLQCIFMEFIKVQCVDPLLSPDQQVLIWWSQKRLFSGSLWEGLVEKEFSPLVLGRIQVTAQWMFRGQPLKTLEKQAPICRNHISEQTTRSKSSSYSWDRAYMDLRGRRKSVTVSPLRRTRTEKVDESVKNHSWQKNYRVFNM